jgi:heat shock protein HslJ
MPTARRLFERRANPTLWKIFTLALVCATAACGPRAPAADDTEPAAAEPSDMIAGARRSEGKPLEGMFRYMADAALFRDCRTNKTYPVAMEGAYKEVESAYLNSGIQAGKEAHVVLTGRLLERPSMENSSSEIKLIVDHFDKLDTQLDCMPVANADLRNTYWKLVEIDGRPVKTPEKQREAHVILASDGSRAHGNAGCNNFFGTFEADEEELHFSALGSTMMNCAAGMDTEKSFLGALGETTRYRISGQSLELFAGDRLLARLEAVYL